MKPQTQKVYNFILFVVILAFIAYVFYRMFSLNSSPRIDDIWVINLDRAPDRWEHMRKQTARLGDMVHRFSAMDGKTITERDSLMKEGVGKIVTVDGNKWDKIINKGAVGCWLSHKRLLQQLANIDRQSDYGHLILEDDVQIPEDFLSGHDTWAKISKNIPVDWDMVYLGLYPTATGTPIADNIVKLQPLGDAQWGTHAYLVKHGSIKTKILPALRFMTAAIDDQYSSLFGDLNAYCIRPSILTLNEEVSSKSTILAIN
jgi:GR25 family glycosyltransferase involved in LPS biosynthesis